MSKDLVRNFAYQNSQQGRHARAPEQIARVVPDGVITAELMKAFKRCKKDKQEGGRMNWAPHKKNITANDLIQAVRLETQPVCTASWPEQ